MVQGEVPHYIFQRNTFPWLTYYGTYWNQNPSNKRLKCISEIVTHTWPVGTDRISVRRIRLIGRSYPKLTQATRKSRGSLYIQGHYSGWQILIIISRLRPLKNMLEKISLRENMKIFVFILVILPASSSSQNIYLTSDETCSLNIALTHLISKLPYE